MESRQRDAPGNIYCTPETDECVVVTGIFKVPSQPTFAMVRYQDNSKDEVPYSMLGKEYELEEERSLPVDLSFFNSRGAISKAGEYGTEFAKSIVSDMSDSYTVDEISGARARDLFEEVVKQDYVLAVGENGEYYYSELVDALIECGANEEDIEYEVENRFVECITSEL